MLEKIQSMSPDLLLAVALLLLALALLSLGLGLAGRAMRARKRAQEVERVMALREGQADAGTRPHLEDRLQHVVQEAAALGERWEQGKFGDSLLAAEDKALIDLCGFANPGSARALFVFGRALLALVLPLFGWIFIGAPAVLGNPFLGGFLIVFAGFGVGWMLPKWWLSRRAQARKQAAADELPLLLDLLRLLQGVGLSIDQSLYVIVNDFREVMPVLSYEFQLATEQYAHGRTREQSFQRLAKNFENDDLGAICALIDQVDRHGGAVQEPLTQFAERLREKRRLGLKEKVGKLTVKMTGVMVMTLLPALLIVTGGAGFLAVLRGLSRMGGA